MTIVTNVSNSLLRPQTFHTFNVSRAGGQLTSVPLTVALIGAQSSTATATANTIYDVTGLTPAQTDAMFGQSSEIALMRRQSILCANTFGQGPRVICVPIAESAGVKNVQTITSTGAATASGNVIVAVAGRTVSVGVSSGDTQNTIAAAIASALNAIAATLPVIVTVATNVVTLTHATKGVNGIDVVVTVNQQISGNALAVATTVVGTSVTDHAPALTSLAPFRYDGIVFANHASADITEIVSDIAVRWAPSSKVWALYFVAEMGSIGTATALAAAGNDKALQVASFQGCLNTAGEMATTHACMVYSRERINASFDNFRVPLYPPPAATIYTPAQVETALAAGLTPFTGVFDSTRALVTNMAKCERAVTSHTTLSSQQDSTVRDIAVPRSMIGVAVQIDIAAESRFGATNNPDGVRQSSSTDTAIKKMWSGIARAFATAEVFDPDQVEADLTLTVIEHDSVTAGRTNVAMFWHLLGSQHQITWQQNITVP